MRTYVFKLYQSKKHRRLHRTIDVAGCIWNHLIALHRRYYHRYQKSLNITRIQLHITKLKKTKRFAFWSTLGSQAIQDIAQRIDRAYRLFFRNLKHGLKTAPPNFRAVKKYRSFTLKQAGWKLLPKNRVVIMGKEYKYFKSREVAGKVKTVTVKRDSVGDLWLFFVVEEGEVPIEVRSGEIVGLDFGLKTFLTTSKGEYIQSPLFFKRNAKLLKDLSRKLSRKKPGSNNRSKARLALARAHRRTANQRRDFHFKTALALAREYVPVVVENLNLKAMQRLWGRKISDLGHAAFLNILSWECFKNGSRLLKIDRFYPSSKTCSKCGYALAELPLSMRSWQCPICSAVHDRDINAAKNIQRVGASTLKGEDVRPASAGCLCRS